MKTPVAAVTALMFALVVHPLQGQTSTSRDNDAETAYIAAMKRDLRHLATAEEAYFVDHSAYYSGPVSAAKPLYGFSPSLDISITASVPAGAPMWSAVASHALTQTKCSYKLPDPIECVSPAPPPSVAATDSNSAVVISIGDPQPVGIRAGQTRKWSFEIQPERTRCLAMGQVETLSGGDQNVSVVILRESAYDDWQADRPVRTDYESGERRVIAFDVNINDAGRYLFVVSNRSSKTGSKVVQLQHVTVTCAE
ncbi:MAG TPA: hypothetical protein VFP26_02885 [Gemmatimonadaceae bacterium]|nr:hypothetical protein [Gemmatimonadaceae bacterium]